MGSTRSSSIQVRPALPTDRETLASLRTALWPDGSIDDHRRELEAILAGRPRSSLPLTIFVVEEAARLIGFIEVGLRSHADGCDPARSCGFVEGWYVVPDRQGRGAGRLLMDRAEAWARDQGCEEMASDTWIEQEVSQRAHEALGFTVVDRCVHYRKRL